MLQNALSENNKIRYWMQAEHGIFNDNTLIMKHGILCSLNSGININLKSKWYVQRYNIDIVWYFAKINFLSSFRISFKNFGAQDLNLKIACLARQIEYHGAFYVNKLSDVVLQQTVCGNPFPCIH